MTGPTKPRLAWRCAMLASLCLGAGGCRHKTVVATIPLPPPQQLPVDTTAKTPGQPEIQPVTVPPVPLTSVQLPTKKVKKPKKASVAVAAPAPPAAEVASAGAPPANLIGALTPGGSDTPEVNRNAEELIAELDKRLAALPQAVKDRQRVQLMQVQNFRRDALTALRASDAQGAMTLATKAKLLLDDLVK